MYKEIQNLTKVITTEFAGAVKGGKSYHLTPSPSPEIGEGRKITSPHPHPFSLMRRREQSAAFTLAETLITVVILGILAAILVPNLIKNQVENANRTKVKKAMAAYEKAINYMIIENNIKSTENLRELGQDNCQYTREYFKTVQDGSNNCIFKTADRVWWDITDITNPILILKDSQLEKSETELKTLAKDLSDKTVFALIGRFDDLGTLRVNDNAYEQGLENNTLNQKYMKKLWYFATLNDFFLNSFEKCRVKNEKKCIISVNGENEEYELVNISEYTYEDICVYDREQQKQICNQTSKTIEGDYYVRSFGSIAKLGITEEDAKSEENCASAAHLGYCKTNGDIYEAGKRFCESQGARYANIAELISLAEQGKLLNGYNWALEERQGGMIGYIVQVYKSNYLGVGANHYKGYSENNAKNHTVLCISDD